MKSADFLKQLESALSGMPADERKEILRDQEEYIRDAVAHGRNEEEVVASLGSPSAFASSLSVESKIQNAESEKTLRGQVGGIIGAVVAVLALAPLNLIFVLGPFIALCACDFAFWVVAIVGFFVSLLGLALWGLSLFVTSVGFATHAASFFLVVGSVGASVLGLFVMALITRYLVKGTATYLRWNLNFIKGRA